MKLYNTLSRSKEPLPSPDQQKTITLYTCGPTVYDETHIGHMRKYTMDDILKRSLKLLGYDVKHVMNITDVGHLTGDDDNGEDKLEKGAKKQGKTVWDVAKEFEEKFWDTLRALNIDKKDIKIMHATENIQEMIKLSKILKEKGFTYETDEALYFNVAKFSNYGKLSGQKLEDKRQAFRANVNIDPQKKNPADFALWFKRVGRFADHTMYWTSPWGDGFPGWHIECSAMSMKGLEAETIDIHTGGIDHIPVHHENEIAQSEAVTGKPFVKWWVHHAFLNVDREKMSKSKENFYTLEDLKKHKIDPLALRYLFLQTHYRKPMNFTWEAAKGAEEGYNRLRDYYIRIQAIVNNLLGPEYGSSQLLEIQNIEKDFLGAFSTYIEDDLNTSKTLSVLWDVIGANLPEETKKRIIEKFDIVLGFNLKRFDEINLPSRIKQLKDDRDDLRARKEYQKADQVKLKLNNLGYFVQDSTLGTIVLPKNK